MNATRLCQCQCGCEFQTSHQGDAFCGTCVVRCATDKAKAAWSDGRVTTTDGLPPREGLRDAPAPAPAGPDGQNQAYYVLTPQEIAKGLARPVRVTYSHTKCGHQTKCGKVIAETFARDPKFYSHTFCSGCLAHFPVDEFVWDDCEKVGS